MKKSEMYYKAHLEVAKTLSLAPEEKIEIIIELQEKRSVALYLEREEEKAAAEKEAE